MSCHTLFYLKGFLMTIFNGMKTRVDLAKAIDIPLKTLTYILYVKGVNNYYTSFMIDKKNGTQRLIEAPQKELKQVQVALEKLLMAEQVKVWKEKDIHPNLSHAFIKKKGIISNASIHRNKRFVLNLDLKDFFYSFHFGRVRGFFLKNRDFACSEEVATVIAQLCCYNGRLPQGAPTSPVITNLIFQIVDWKILLLAKKYKVDYTRYADDLTFSTNIKTFDEDEFIAELRKIIEYTGFQINEHKTRLSFKDSRQEVTGLVVNKKINVKREYYRTTRAMLSSLYKIGTFTIEESEGKISQLEGRLSFIDQIDHYNNIHNGATKSLNAREKQYRDFLFYKHFYHMDKPVVVTEGKTDARYIRAALKKYYAEYPELIRKDEEGRFEYKISFFKRTDKISYLFGMAKDGADSMTKIYNLYSGKGGAPNLYDKFHRICAKSAQWPTMLLFDNEMSGERKKQPKPLRKFVRNFDGHLGEKIIISIEEKQHALILDDSNLYLVTIPLVKGKTECEIEDLFDEKTLGIKIAGKSFSCSGNFDEKVHYGKDIFSKYVLSHYEEIDMENFKALLNTIRNVIIEYKEAIR